jgi:hypothetical protein
MKLRKLAALALVSVFFVATVSASSFGSFSSETEKEIDSLETGFTISVFNLGNETLSLNVTSSDPEGASIVHENEFELEPSEVTRNPSGDKSWFLTSNNRYVETTEIPIRFFRDSDTSRNNFDFTVDIRASTAVEEGGSGVVQNIVQVRSYSYQVETDFSGSGSSPDEPDSPDAPEQSPEPADPGSIVDDVGDAIGGIGGDQDQGDQETETGTGDTGSDDSTDNTDNPDSEDSSNEDSETGTENTSEDGNSLTGQFLQSASVNGTTIVMFVFMTGSLIYFMRVI